MLGTPYKPFYNKFDSKFLTTNLKKDKFHKIQFYGRFIFKRRVL